MKLYHHYKSKPYKYVGLARHSETLEEMVIYETRYENANGKVWVRPKSMFFESVQAGGQHTPRFKEVPLKLIETTDIAETDVNSIAPVLEKAFGEWDRNRFYAKFKNHGKFYLITAFIEDQAVGFKLGFELDSHEFYSWLGGVLPEYRGLGIASDLMKRQHEWCRKNGYSKIQTKTQNRFREMFVLSLKHGFDVKETQQSAEGRLEIVLEKRLK